MSNLTHIPEEVAERLTYGGSGDDGYAYVAKQFVDKHRWYNNYLIVFMHDGAHYGFNYMEPATEMQEGQDTFDTDMDGNVPVKPATSKQVTTTEWHI